MSVEVERATLPCSVCGASVSELRRGRCWGCYTRWAESRPVGRGAACTVCGEKRRAQLKLVEIWRRSLPFCHGCAAQVMRLPDLPGTVEELRYALRRDRRDADRRAGSKADQRMFPRERRVGERRGPSRDAFADTDPRIKLAELQTDDVVLELGETDLEPGDQTQVRGNARSAAQPLVTPPPVPVAAEAAMPAEQALPPAEEAVAAEAPPAEAPPADVSLSPEASSSDELSLLAEALSAESTPPPETPPAETTAAADATASAEG